MTKPSARTRTYVYIDGFNFYYGCFRRPGRTHWKKYKWLDLEKMCDALLPKDNVVAIKYYTADVSNRPPDNRQSVRQQAYFAALSTLPRFQIIKGHFLGPMPKPMQECDASGNPLGRRVLVLKTEEKGSDVNLAVDLLYDCVKDCYDCAVIISNDSDLVSAVRIVHNDYGKLIGIVNPHHKRPSLALSACADFHKRLRERLLSANQFPPEVRVGSRVVRRPIEWS
jgi:uncharacterized LabA/DUF88 family protein